jgi:hypothetical protein
MDTIYFLAMLVGIAWLAVWSVLPADRKIGGWWPFDMKEPGATPRNADAAPARRGASPSWRQAKDKEVKRGRR